MAKRPGRQKVQLPPTYYEGYLEMKSLKEQASRRLWTCLCGDALFFFNNNKENQYVEKMEVSSFISISDDSSPDKNLNTAGLLIHMKDDNLRLMAPSLETRELWKGFLLSVKELAVPRSLNLLPGQVHMMREVVDKEKTRRGSLSSPSPTPLPSTKYMLDSSSPLYLSVMSEMPACFEAVSRTEAEILLEKYPNRGNLLMRPGRDGASFAVSTRNDLNGSEFKHYRISRKPEGGFYIDLDKPIHCATLQEVVDCLVEKTAGALQPFIMDEPYEKNITFVQADQENGERSLHSVSPQPATPPKAGATPPRAGATPPRACATPPRAGATPPKAAEPKPSPETDPEPEDRIYLSPDDEVEGNEEAVIQKKEMSPPQPLPRQPLLRQQATLPPLPHQRSLPHLRDSPGQKKKSLQPPKTQPAPAPRAAKGPGAPLKGLQDLALSSELQQKLEQRRAKES